VLLAPLDVSDTRALAKVWLLSRRLLLWLPSEERLPTLSLLLLGDKGLLAPASSERTFD